MDVQDTPEGGQMRDLARGVRTSNVKRLRGRGVGPKFRGQDQAPLSPQPLQQNLSSLRRSQRLHSKSSNESLPDPRAHRSRCPYCRQWFYPTSMRLHLCEN